MSPKRIVVIGDVMLDVIVQPTSPLATTSDTPSIVRMGRGGAAANVAVALASYGHEVIYVGVRGDDLAGQMFEDDLTRAGVTPALDLSKGSTGVVVALIDRDGQRAMMTDRGVNGLLAREALTRNLGRPFDHLHVSGYTLLDGRTRRIGSQALKLARSKGATTSVDVCSVGPLARVTVPVFLAAAERSSMLFANAEEALMMTESSDVIDAAHELAQKFDEVLVTRGREGALAAVGENVWRRGSKSVEVLDTTGAGDAASGTYLAARVNGESVDDSLIKAMEAAAVVVRGLGSRG